ncbi:MAG: cytochrome c biogenesis heme-transporting ATPase CcmA [Pseudomonadota bacterium]
MLELTNLYLWRGERLVLNGMSLAVAQGQALQLLWPNGAGKTSLLRCVAGFLHAEEGTIRWKGADTAQDLRAFHGDLAYLGHELALKGDLTTTENLHYSLGLRRSATDAQIASALQSLGLVDAETELVRRLSAGQQRRVALARLCLWDAQLWLLDEPAANLDAAGQRHVTEAIARHLAAGGSAIIASHQALALDAASSRISLKPGDLQ